MKQAALAAGFHQAGVARAGPLDPGPLDRMLSLGAEADMAWLRTQRDVRLDPRLLLPGCRSVVALAVAHDGEAAARRARQAPRWRGTPAGATTTPSSRRS